MVVLVHSYISTSKPDEVAAHELQHWVLSSKSLLVVGNLQDSWLSDFGLYSLVQAGAIFQASFAVNSSRSKYEHLLNS
jgi:hypothetical protein